jgi:hypothetical protein
MAAPKISVQEAQYLFANYNNISETDAQNFVDYVFGVGDRTITGNLTVTGEVKTPLVDQVDSTAGLTIGASTSKLGFYGHAVEVQQVLATGAGHTADNIITFLQGIGLCKQA